MGLVKCISDEEHAAIVQGWINCITGYELVLQTEVSIDGKEKTV